MSVQQPISEKNMKAIHACSNTDLTLKQYQLALAYWMFKHPKQKGIMANYPTGTGKTLLGANVAQMLKELGRIDHVVAVVPKSLVTNMENAIRFCLGSENVPSYFKVHTYDKFRLSDMKLRPKTLLIVDEMHNLRNSSTSRSQAVQKAAQQARHVLELTADPLVNSPSDISVPMRMLVPRSKWGQFPLTHEVFLDLYKNNKTRYIKAVKNKIAIYVSKNSTKPRVEEKVIAVPLSDKQIALIKDIRDKALTPRLIKLLRQMLESGSAAGMGDAASKKLNAFLTRVRQVSNSVNPKDNCDPKVERLVKKAVRGPKPVIIYSQFREYGIDNVEHCLKRAGVDGGRIAQFTGAIGSLKERQRIIDDYNGGKIDYLLLTSAAAEGISLRETRQIHVLEPYWNWARLNQVVGRGVRIDSHTHLPKDQRLVQVYYWLAIMPKNSGADASIAPDPHLYVIAQKKRKLIDQFNRWNLEASIPTDIDFEVEERKAPPKKKSAPKRKKLTPAEVIDLVSETDEDSPIVWRRKRKKFVIEEDDEEEDDYMEDDIEDNYDDGEDEWLPGDSEDFDEAYEESLENDFEDEED
jgi:SNF2 family DNA or RNA helicase